MRFFSSILVILLVLCFASACKNTKYIGDFIPLEDVDQVFVTVNSNTIELKKNQVELLKKKLKEVPKVRGPWKYRKFYKIVLVSTSRRDTIMSNGELFGPYKINYFKSKVDIIKPFMEEN